MKVITCFSFKGGAGRTVASANLAAAMASTREGVGSIQRPLDRKTAILDLDVFAAGTHRVFQISNRDLTAADGLKCLQDFLDPRDARILAPREFVEEFRISTDNKKFSGLMAAFAGRAYCRNDFALFASRPDPSSRFLVQKHHENLLLGLLQALEEDGYEYVFIDGESGIRSMADIAVRVADVVLMLFRMTWQHTEGTIAAGDSMLAQPRPVPFILLPSCVPLVDDESCVYKPDAPGFAALKKCMRRSPRDEAPMWARVHEFADRSEQQARGAVKPGLLLNKELFIHESLFLMGEERVVVFGRDFVGDRAARDYYAIARELDDQFGE